MKKVILTLLTLLVAISIAVFLYFQVSDCGIAPWSCGDYASQKEWKTQKIAVADGPEDMALDNSVGTNRLIVSCAPRRGNRADKGGFYQINPTDNKSTPFTIIPSDLEIRPHGIDVVNIGGVPMLYAISHDPLDGEMQHQIFRFIIKKDTLLQDENFTLKHPLLTGPNDLDVLEDGSFYVSNPMPSNDPMESTKAIVGIKTGNVLHYDGIGNWSVAIKDMCYPNGVWVNQEKEYIVVANGGCQEVVRYAIKDGKVDQTNKISTKDHDIEIPIGDNLMMDNRGVLWTAAHPCPLKFLDHVKDSNSPSPSQVFAMDPMTLKGNRVFQTNGELISAASTVVRLEDRLYISQVFDPFVLVVNQVEL